MPQRRGESADGAGGSSDGNGNPHRVDHTLLVSACGRHRPLVVNWLREAFARHVGGELVIVGDVGLRSTRSSSGDAASWFSRERAPTWPAARLRAESSQRGMGPALADQG